MRSGSQLRTWRGQDAFVHVLGCTRLERKEVMARVPHEEDNPTRTGHDITRLLSNDAPTAPPDRSWPVPPSPGSQFVDPCAAVRPSTHILLASLRIHGTRLWSLQALLPFPPAPLLPLPLPDRCYREVPNGHCPGSCPMAWDGLAFLRTIGGLREQADTSGGELPRTPPCAAGAHGT